MGGWHVIALFAVKGEKADSPFALGNFQVCLSSCIFDLQVVNAMVAYGVLK